MASFVPFASCQPLNAAVRPCNPKPSKFPIDGKLISYINRLRTERYHQPPREAPNHLRTYECSYRSYQIFCVDYQTFDLISSKLMLLFRAITPPMCVRKTATHEETYKEPLIFSFFFFFFFFFGEIL